MHTNIERTPMAVPVVVPRIYHLEFTCDGQAFNWTGAAHSKAEAESKARRALYLDAAGFFNSRATLVRCEVAA